METWTKEDIELVEKFIEIKNKGYYVDGKQLTDVYNRVLNKKVNVTNCGSCLRGRTNELEAALNRMKAKLEVKDNVTQEKVTETENVTLDKEPENKEPEPPKKTGKKTKKTE